MTDVLQWVDRMPGLVCPACGWWRYDSTDHTRDMRPLHCPDCEQHHGKHTRLTPVWVRYEPREAS